MGSVLNIAHRGGAALWPENTMPAFEQATALGVDGFELDVHLCADGEIAVYHDEALKPDLTRGSDGRWLSETGPLLKDLTFDALQAFDVGRARPGSACAQSHPHLKGMDGVRIPHLRDVIGLIKGRRQRLWIELKSNFAQEGRTASPEAFAERVVRLLKGEQVEDHAILIGFDWRALIAAKRIAPHIPVWCTTLPQSWFGAAPPSAQDWPPPERQLAQLRAWDEGAAPWTGGFDKGRYGGLLPAVRALGAQAWFGYHPDLTDARVAQARAQGLQAGAWTVNEEGEMRRLIGVGATALCTDRPDLAKIVIAGSSGPEIASRASV